MASRIFLGGLKPMQDSMNTDPNVKPFKNLWEYYLCRENVGGNLVIIMKGNIIEGIEAKI